LTLERGNGKESSITNPLAPAGKGTPKERNTVEKHTTGKKKGETKYPLLPWKRAPHARATFSAEKK